MRALLVVVGLVSAGCDSLLGLNAVEEPADEDVEPDGGRTPDAPACDDSIAMLPSVFDSFLDTPTPHGDRPFLVVDAQRTLIVSFHVQDVAVTNATLRLEHPSMARGCATGGSACEPCASGGTGELTVRWMRADWNELATSTERDADGRQWAGDNASGAVDRGTTAVMTTYTAGSGLEITLSRTPSDQRSEWFGAGHVALQITTTAANATFASREGAADSCGSIAPPTLVIGCSPQ